MDENKAVVVPPPYESIEWGDEGMKPVGAYDQEKVHQLFDSDGAQKENDRMEALRILGKHVAAEKSSGGDDVSTAISRAGLEEVLNEWQTILSQVVLDTSADDVHRQLSTLIYCKLIVDTEVRKRYLCN